MDAHSPEEIKKHVRVYLLVFAALAVLTGVTVGLYYINFPPKVAIAVALAVATLKASLVCLFFMHLKNEVKTIFWVLILTIIFFRRRPDFARLDPGHGGTDVAAVLKDFRCRSRPFISSSSVSRPPLV